jgi:hypothetical protein
MWTKKDLYAIWKDRGVTEIFDEDALKFNLERLNYRLKENKDDELNRSAVIASINHLKEGLKILCEKE